MVPYISLLSGTCLFKSACHSSTNNRKKKLILCQGCQPNHIGAILTGMIFSSTLLLPTQSYWGHPNWNDIFLNFAVEEEIQQ